MRTMSKNKAKVFTTIKKLSPAKGSSVNLLNPFNEGISISSVFCPFGFATTGDRLMKSNFILE